MGKGWEGMGGTVGVIADGKRVWVPNEAERGRWDWSGLPGMKKVQQLGIV